MADLAWAVAQWFVGAMVIVKWSTFIYFDWKSSRFLAAKQTAAGRVERALLDREFFVAVSRGDRAAVSGVVLTVLWAFISWLKAVHCG